MTPDELDKYPGTLKRHEVKDASLIRQTFVDGLSPDEIAGLLSTQADSIMYWQGMYVKACQDNEVLRGTVSSLHQALDRVQAMKNPSSQRPMGDMEHEHNMMNTAYVKDLETEIEALRSSLASISAVKGEEGLRFTVNAETADWLRKHPLFGKEFFEV